MSKGQSLESLVNMPPLEWAFLRAAWALELDYIAEVLTNGQQKR